MTSLIKCTNEIWTYLEVVPPPGTEAIDLILKSYENTQIDKKTIFQLKI